MGLFDSLVNSVLGNSDKSTAVARAAGRLIGSEGTGEGILKLVQQFQRRGMADVVGSWISTGDNQSITAGQLEDALGPDRVADLAQQAGLTPAEASDGLAKVLPQIIDRITPGGGLPPDHEIADLLRRM